MKGSTNDDDDWHNLAPFALWHESNIRGGEDAFSPIHLQQRFRSKFPLDTLDTLDRFIKLKLGFQRCVSPPPLWTNCCQLCQ